MSRSRCAHTKVFYSHPPFVQTSNPKVINTICNAQPLRALLTIHSPQQRRRHRTSPKPSALHSTRQPQHRRSAPTPSPPSNPVPRAQVETHSTIPPSRPVIAYTIQYPVSANSALPPFSKISQPSMPLPAVLPITPSNAACRRVSFHISKIADVRWYARPTPAICVAPAASCLREIERRALPLRPLLAGH